MRQSSPNNAMHTKRMRVRFQTSLWQLDVPPPWSVVDAEDCTELTQPEGVGAMHISAYRKQEGVVTKAEAMERMKEDYPGKVSVAQVQCGEFAGFLADYVDWHSDAYWRKWILFCRTVLLFATYTCKRGDEDLEADQAASLLERLRCKV